MEAFKKKNIHTGENKEDDLSDEEDEDFLNNKGQLPYTQEAIIRGHLKRLAKFLRLSDLQILSSKLFLCHSTILKLLSIIYYKEEIKEEEPVYGLKINKKTLLKVFIDFRDKLMLFTPICEDIQILIQRKLNKVFAMLLNSYILMSAPEFTRFTKSLDEFEDKQMDLNPDLLEIVENDSEM